MDAEDSDCEDEERWSEPADEQHLNGVGLGVWQRSSHQPANVPADRKANVLASCSSSSGIVSRMALNDNKAGMDGLDKEKINRIILEASKGSRFYENERKKEAQVNQRIEHMMQQLAGITEQQQAVALLEVDAVVAELEATRSFSRSIVHLDMDAFYAAVEMRDNTSLKDKPMAVGSMSMLSTSNYHARRYGVRAAMPGFIAKKLCPELVIVSANFDKYRTVSEQVREILGQYDPNFCPMSLDEAYFDLTDYLERRRAFSEAERTFEYGGWNQDAAQSGNDETKIEDAVSGGQNEGRERGGSACSCLRSRTGKVGDHCAHWCENAQQDSMKQNERVTAGGVSGDDDILQSGRSRFELTSQTCPCAKSTPVPSESPKESSGVGNNDSIPLDGSVTSRKTRGRTFGFTVEEVVEEIRFRIEQKTQLTASAGIAPNVMLAKICSDKNKPNGHYRIQPNRDSVMEFIRELPIRKVSGIGKVTEKLLAALGIQNCTHLYQQRALLYFLFSPTSSQHFLRISLGLGSTRVERDGERKSMSTERTFSELHRPADLYNKCNELCQALAEDLQKQELMGKTVTIKIKTVKFEVKTKACSVPSCIHSADCIFNVAKDLLRAEINACKPEPLRLRLMGVRLSNLQSCSTAENKQDSITKFFKKQAETSAPQLPAAKHATNDADRILQLQKETAMSFSSDSTRNGLETGLSIGVPPEPESKPRSSLSKSNAASSSSIDSRNHSNIPPSQLRPEDQRITQSSDHRTGDDIRTERGFIHDGHGTSPSEIQCAASSSELVCPVCNVAQLRTDLEAFNEHVDVCLNRGAIRDMLRQQASQEKPCSSRSSTSPTKGKRSLSGPKSAPKRRKQEKAQTNTLDKFFS